MDAGALGFWLFIAAVVVGGMWSDARKKAERHETLRRIIEKTGTIDEARLKALFRDEENAETKPGYAYRGLRIGGTIVLFLAAAIATFFILAAMIGTIFGSKTMLADMPTALIIGLAVSASIAVLGLGLFFSSRFATPPVDAMKEPPAR